MWSKNNTESVLKTRKKMSLKKETRYRSFLRKSLQRVKSNNFKFCKLDLEKLLYNHVSLFEHLNKFNYNCNDYHIDHIIPVTVFNVNNKTTKTDLLKINDLRNLMPLDGKSNISKHNKITFEYVPDWHFKDLSSFIKEMVDLELLDASKVLIKV